MLKTLHIFFIAGYLLFFGIASGQDQFLAILKDDTLRFGDDTLMLSAGEYRGDIQWQSSADIHLWDNINGAVYDSLQIRVDTCAYYRFKVSEGTCQPVYSDVTQVYVKDTCDFFPSKLIGDYITVLEHWNDNSGNGYYSVQVSKNMDLSTEDKLVLDISGLFTMNKASNFRISINLDTHLISSDPEDAMVVETDLFGWGYGRLWFEEFSAPYVNTCKDYIRFTVTPYLRDVGAWFGTYVTYYIGPGAAFVRYDKKSAKDYIFNEDQIRKRITQKPQVLLKTMPDQ